MSIRLATRVFMCFSPLGPAKSSSLRLAALGFCVYDVLLARRMASRAIPPAVRAALDAVDVAFWTAIHPYEDDYAGALLPAIPAVVEQAYDRGVIRAIPAAMVPVVVSGTFRAVRSYPIARNSVVWPAVAVVGGAALRWFERRAVGRRRAQEDTELGALRQEAYSRGRTRAVQLLAVTHDDLQRSLVFAEADTAAQLRAVVGGHKAEFYASRSKVPRLLSGALADYAALRQARTSLLAHQVWIEHDTTNGDPLLDPAQIRSLFHALDGLAVRGEVATLALLPDARGALGVVVDDRSRILLPPMPRSAWRIDLATASLLLQAGHHLTALDPAAGGLHRAVPIGAAALTLTGAAVGEPLARRRGAGRGRPLAVAFGLPGALLHALVGTATMRRPFDPDGAPRYPGPTGLTFWGISTAYHWDDLSPKARWSLVAGVVPALAASYLLAPPPRQLAGFASELLWPLVAIASARALRGDITIRSAGILADFDADAAEILLAEEARAEDEEFAFAARLLDVAEQVPAPSDAAHAAAMRATLRHARLAFDDAHAFHRRSSNGTQ